MTSTIAKSTRDDLGPERARLAAQIVCDTGPGIPEAVREKIFEPFVSRSTGGTGLGLAIVARIMEALGGTASLTAREGWTTSVTLTFPQSAPA
jgi:signal transduction histidine kinase